MPQLGMTLAGLFEPGSGRRERKSIMRYRIKWGLVLLPALALAMPAFAPAPAYAARDTALSDSQEPGSVLVFPEFIKNGAVNVDGVPLPRTEIEIGMVCPPGVTPTTTLCFEH